MKHRCAGVLTVASVLLAAGGAFAAEDGLLFHASYDKTIRANVSAAGAPQGRPVKHKVTLVAGKIGKAMDIARGGCVEYRRAGHVQELEGTISFWFKTKFAGDERRGMWRIFFEIDPNHLQFYKSKDGSALRVAYKNFDYKADAVEADISHIKTDEWHQATLCWGKSRIALYLDGKLAEAKDTGGLVPFKSKVMKSNANGDIVIDELKIYDRPTKPLGDPYWVREHETFDLPEWTPKAVEVERDDDDPMKDAGDEHLIFYVPFDEGTKAALANGDAEIEIPEGAKLVKGKYGGAMDSGARPFRFKWKENLDPKEGTLSFWFFSRFSAHMPRPHRAVVFSIGGVNFEMAYWAGMFSMIGRDAATGRYTWAWQAASGGTLRHNQWNHVAAQWKDGKFRLRLNGQLSAMGRYPALAVPDFPYATLNCGRSAVIDDLRIYDKAVLPWLFGPIPFSTEYETHHFKWATPYAGPRTKALVLTDARFPVELSQRADFDVDTVNTVVCGYLHMEDYHGGKWGGVDIRGWIEKKIKEDPWDVLVIDPRGAKYINRTCADVITQRVEAGAGLVLVNGAAASADLADLCPVKTREKAVYEQHAIDRQLDHFITGSFDLSGALTQKVRIGDADGSAIAFAGETPVVVVRDTGKGRVVAFAWEYPLPNVSRYLSGEVRPDAPDRNPDFPTFDSREEYYALTIRAMLWSSRHTSPIILRKLDWNDDQLAVETSNSGAPVDAEVDVRVLDEHSQTVLATHQAKTVAGGDARMTLALPAGKLPGGVNRARVRLITDGKVLDFGQAVVNVSKSVTVAAVSMPKYVYAPGDAVNVEAAFEGDAAGARAVARLLDGRGRVLEEKEAAIGDGKASFSFDAGKVVFTAVARVEVDALVDDVRSDRGVQEFFVPRAPRWEDYTFATQWVGPYSVNWEEEAGRMSIAAGMDFMLTYGLPTNTAKAPDICEAKYLRPFVDVGIGVAPLCIIPSEVRMHHDRARTQWMSTLLQKPPAERTKEDLIRLVCYNDPAFLEKTRSFAEKAARAFRKYGPISYNLQDEMNYIRAKRFGEDAPDCCFCEHCMKKMRTWLKKEYGTLEALNAAWGSSFRSWDVVAPDTFLEAKGKGRYVSWSAHRRFNDISTRDLLAVSREGLRKEDSDAETQVSGTYDASAYSGMDWSEIYKVLESSNGYSNKAARGSLQGRFATEWSSASVNIPWTTGYNAPPHIQRYDVFSHALDGDMGSAWWWSRMLWREDYSTHKWGKTAMAATKVMHDGVARLMRETTSNPDRIAIHHSMASHRLNYALAGGTEKHFRYGRGGWAWLLKEVGFGYSLVDAEHVAEGRLSSRGFKVFIMPSSMAMSSREVAAVEEFARSGGIVIADYAPAIADERLVPAEGSALADLFGIASIGEDLSFDRTRTSLGLPVVERGIEPWTVNTVDKGRAIFVNLDMSDYLRDDGTFQALRNRTGEEAALKEKFLAVLADAGVRPNHSIRTAVGAMLSRTSSHTWVDGDALYVGLIKAGDPPKAIYDKKSGIFLGYEAGKGGEHNRAIDVSIAFDRPRHIYDSRTAEYLGKRSTVDRTIKEHDLTFLSCLPYMVASLDVVMAEAAMQGEDAALAVSVAGDAAAGKHIIRLEWFDPDGRTLDTYCRNYVAPDGKVNIRIKTALNERPGAHRLVFRDVATGIVKSVALRVTERR